MVALGLISLLGTWGFMSVEGDTLQRQDPVMIKPTDTVHIRAQRIDFATMGRVVLPLVSGENDQLLRALMQDAGVFFKQYGITGSSTISRRGADANQTQINWNGLPVNNPMLGMSDFNTFMGWGCGEMFLVEGGNSAVVGSGSMGGTLFMRNSLRFLDEASLIEGQTLSKLMTTTGTYGERNVAAQVGLLGKQTYLSFDVARYRHKNSFLFPDLGLDIPKREMNNALRDQRMLRMVTGYKHGRSQIRAVAEYTGMSRQLGVALGSLQPLGKQLDINLRGLVEHQVGWGHGFSLLQRLGVVMDQIDYYSSSTDSVGSVSRGKTLHYQNELYYTLRGLRLLLGTDFQYQWAHTAYYLGWARRALPASLLGVYWSQRKWSAVGNARYEWNERMPTAGISIHFQASRRLAWKWNLHSSFRRPTLNDLFWVSGAALTPLRSEKGWGSEVGLQFQSHPVPVSNAKIKCSAEITAYHRELDYPILWVPSGAVWRATNLSGGGRYSGAQLSLQCQYHLRRSIFVLQSNFDRVNALVKQSTNTPEYQQIFVPNYNGNILLAWQRPTHRIALNSQWVGDRFIQTDNQAQLPAYKLINLQWQLPSIILHKKAAKLEFGLQCQNILNTQYQSIPGRPMPGRTIQFSVWLKHQHNRESDPVLSASSCSNTPQSNKTVINP